MKNFVFLLIFGFPYCISANSSVNASLLAAQAELNVSSSTGTRMSMAGSWLDEAQFRFNASEGNKFDTKERGQSYEIRVRPKAWGQHEVEESILDLRSEQQNYSYNFALNAALKKRYLVLLAYLEQHNITQYLFNLLALSTQEAEFIRSEVMTDRFSAEKFFDAVEMTEQSEGLAILNLARLNALQTQIGVPLDTADSVLHTFTVESMLDPTDYTDKFVDMNNALQSAPAVLNEHLALEMAKAKGELIKTERQLGVNLLSFGYKDRAIGGDNMTFQVGINIPLGRHFSSAESQYELYEAQTHLNDRITAIAQSLTNIQKEISWLMEEIKLADLQVHRVQKHLEKEYVKANPLQTIQLRKELIEYRKKRNDIKIKALSLYVSSLTLSGFLIREPLRNWIQSGTPELVSGKEY